MGILVLEDFSVKLPEKWSKNWLKNSNKEIEIIIQIGCIFKLSQVSPIHSHPNLTTTTI